MGSGAIKVTEPSGATTETEYDGAGQVIDQIDGNKHATKYVRNVLEQVTEVIDPLLRKTTKTYDAAGDMLTVTDPLERTTTYTYNKDNELTKTVYSDGVTPTVEYEYDGNGNRTKMIDGTGTTTYTYDQLDRLTKTEDGHGDTVGYEYDLANELTKITYPNGKSVERSYDKTGRLHSVTDWLERTTSFTYNRDSNLTATTFPSGTGEQDTYAYSAAGQQTEIKMGKGEETLASLIYTRDKNGQVTKTVSKGLPGAETVEDEYDENERLTTAGTAKYGYDAADNPTTIPGSTNVFDAADELTEGTTAKYTYDKVGARTKTTPTVGPATTYGYNQAGDLTSVSRPEEGEVSKIEDKYSYDGDGLRVAQTVNGIANYFTWDETAVIPLLLDDGVNSYVYGPGYLPIEQINTKEESTYLHHDQQGSTRLLTGSTGSVTGSTTFDAYGNTTGSTGTSTTSLGYDAQYTSSDTGLIYLRARIYDPTTAQFLSRDPLASLTREPYVYGGENPVNLGDPTGFEALPLPIEGPAGAALCADPVTAAICIGAGGYIIAKGFESIVNTWTGEEGGDEGEAELKRRESERESCIPNFTNSAEPPGEGWEWRGNGPIGSKEGSWFNPETRESLHPDLSHGEPIGPHYDYTAPDGLQYRIYPDGRIEPTKP